MANFNREIWGIYYKSIFLYLSIRERYREEYGYRIEYDSLKAGEVERIEFSASKSTVVAGSIGKIRMSCIWKMEGHMVKAIEWLLLWNVFSEKHYQRALFQKCWRLWIACYKAIHPIVCPLLCLLLLWRKCTLWISIQMVEGFTMDIVRVRHTIVIVLSIVVIRIITRLVSILIRIPVVWIIWTILIRRAITLLSIVATIVPRLLSRRGCISVVKWSYGQYYSK